MFNFSQVQNTKKSIRSIIGWIGLILLVITLAVINSHEPRDYTPYKAAIPSSQQSLKQAIQDGFQKGKVEFLYPYFDEIISICIADKEDIYLAYNAKAALSNFFASYPPKRFNLRHDGKSRAGIATYWIGDYFANSGERFRVYFFTEKELIQAIEIAPIELTL